MTLRVLLADDETLVRTGLRMILGAEDDVEVVAEATNGEEALRLVDTLCPDVLLLDLHMPLLDGLGTLRHLRAAGSTVAVVVLTTFDNDANIFDALDEGARGFLLKDAPATQLVAALRAAAAGDAVLAPSVARTVTAELRRRRPPAGIDRLAELTSREREVLALLAQGLSNGEIADRLVITEGTVKTHVARVLQKLGVRDRLQAVVAAYQGG